MPFIKIAKRIKDCYDYFIRPKHQLNKKKLGLNCFFNTKIFPSNNIAMQGLDIKDSLGIDTVRVLFNWNDAVQSTQTSQIDWGFYDDILKSLPTGMKVLIILNGEPTWVKLDSKFKKRQDFIDYCHAAVDRYKSNDKVIGFQIGNEINTTMFPENADYCFTNPAFYLEVMFDVANYIKKKAPTKLVVGAATTSIIQSFPKTLEFNKKLIDSGEQDVVDVWAIHYYGNNPWALLRPNGVLDFLQSLNKPIWITEIGSDKPEEHVKYLLKHITYLEHKVPSIQKFFIYQYDGSRDTLKYGIRNESGTFSPLYKYIKDIQ